MKLIIGIEDLLVNLGDIESGEKEPLLSFTPTKRLLSDIPPGGESLRFMSENHPVLAYVTMLYQSRRPTFSRSARNEVLLEDKL